MRIGLGCQIVKELNKPFSNFITPRALLMGLPTNQSTKNSTIKFTRGLNRRLSIEQLEYSARSADTLHKVTIERRKSRDTAPSVNRVE